MCQLRLLALAGMIGREGSRLHHSDQEMGDPSVLERSLRRQLRHPPCSDHQKPVLTGQTAYQYSQPAVGGSDRHLNWAVNRPVR